MAREKKEKPVDGMAAWLVTFSDLVTLLLTFFVLLLSMASMDKVMLARVNPFQNDFNIVNYRGAGKVPSRIQHVLDLLDDPETILDKKQRIKDLLFPDDILPPDLDASTLEKNLRLLEKPEGLAIVLTDDLLFEPGSYRVSESAKKLLAQVALMLQYSPADCNIAGHTDNTNAGSVNNYELSGLRASAVLEYFLREKFSPTRFSISGYGADKPMEPNTSAETRSKNNRVEILLKTTQWIGRYV